MKNKELTDALKNAFDVCFLVQDQLANVLASDSLEAQSPADKEYHAKATKYIKWYVKTFKK